LNNGGHNGATCAINTFPGPVLKDSNTASPASRLLRFLRTLHPAQINPHCAAGSKQNTFAPTFNAPSILPPTRDLSWFTKIDEKALCLYHGYAQHVASEEALAAH
jgi:hypothetical protein